MFRFLVASLCRTVSRQDDYADADADADADDANAIDEDDIGGSRHCLKLILFSCLMR